MSQANKLVTIEKCSDLLGYSEEAIRQLKKKGQIREKIHWHKAPNGRIFIDLEAFNKWIVGKQA